MSRIDLPSGGWAELKEPEQVLERHRRPISRAITRLSQEAWQILIKLEADKVTAVTNGDVVETAALADRFSEADLDAFSDANDWGVVALVSAWSFQEPLSLESVQNRTAPDYDALRNACAPAVGRLFVDFSPTRDSDSPTAPSSDSATRSGEVSLTSSPTTGEPTA